MSLPQAPGFQATTQETSRVLTRGQLEFFTWEFFYDSAKTQPILPLDIQAYPSYRILDPSGAILAQGVGVPAGAPGVWKIGWVVPKAAQLTNPHRRYQMATVMVDKEMRQWELSWEFDVVESAITPQEPELQQFLTFVNTPIRLFFKNTVRPSTLSVNFFAKGVDGSPLFTAYLTYPIPNPAGPYDLLETQIGTGFTYYIDTPSIALPGSYSALWQVRDTVVSSLDFEHQVVQVIATNVAHMMNSVRMLIDKLQKKLGLAFAYANEDIYEYLSEGMKLINSYWPPSNYNVNAPPNSIEAFIVLAAAWWGLTAQRILYAETNLNFCVDLNTLLPTPKGLIRAKDLVFDNSVMLKKRISTQLIYDTEEELFDTICSTFGEGTRSIEIIENLNLSRCPVSLGGLFTRFTLNEFKSFNSYGKPVWNIPKFKQHLVDNYGMFHEIEEGGYATTIPLLTPYGFDLPECVWYLKQKQVYKIENELGYDIIATGNHPILTLNTTTFEMLWKNIDEIEVGDLIALNTKSNEEEEDWEVSLEDYVNAVKKTNTCKTQSLFNLPNKMTPELARLIGYLVAEGCFTQYDLIRFSNTDKQIIDDFNYCCLIALGKEANFDGVDTNNNGNFGSGDNKPLYKYSLSSVELRRFFFALGMGYEKSKEQSIPSLIFRSPKYIAKEFLRGFFEGDGCFTEGMAIFTSSSLQLLIDIQQLLLRFGIISKKVNPKDDLVGRVTVRGLSLVRYAKEIGWLFKGNNFEEKTRYYPQREALNPEVLYGLINIRELLGLNIKGWKNTSEGKKRYSVYWDHNAKGSIKNGHCQCQYITWDHVEDWFSDRGAAIRELNPEIWNRINLLLETKFLWKKVKVAEKLNRRDVIDPSFTAHDNYLDHAFMTNGLITHNSGQTVTLEYNPGADIDSIISTMKETLDNSVPKVKLQLSRLASGVGAIATRPYRYRTNVVFPVSSGPGMSYFIQLQQMGLIDWLG
jgi:intein/homing endonuclease